MKSFKTRLMTALLISAVFFQAAGVPAAARPVRAPNIVLILADDMSWNYFGFMGNTTFKTPSIDRLAAEGAVFPESYIPTPRCRASHATLLTGLYAHEHQVCANDLESGQLQEIQTLPKILKAAGYESFQAGKLWDGSFAEAGFTRGMKGGTGPEAQKPPERIIGRRTLKPIFRFIDRVGDKPFFLYFAPVMPHRPHTPPNDLLEKYRRTGLPEHAARYAAMCEWFDLQCGKILDYLKQKGLQKDTVVIFAVDNGWQLPKAIVHEAHYRSKDTPYDLGVRFPLIISWPGKIQPARHSSHATTLDILPTVAELCGIPLSNKTSGLSLAGALLRNEKINREELYGAVYTHADLRLAHPELHPDFLWIRRGRWKFILGKNGRKPEYELYDLSADPLEERELSARHPTVTRDLKGRLEAWAKRF